MRFIIYLYCVAKPRTKVIKEGLKTFRIDDRGWRTTLKTDFKCIQEIISTISVQFITNLASSQQKSSLTDALTNLSVTKNGITCVPTYLSYKCLHQLWNTFNANAFVAITRYFNGQYHKIYMVMVPDYNTKKFRIANITDLDPSKPIIYIKCGSYKGSRNDFLQQQASMIKKPCLVNECSVLDYCTSISNVQLEDVLTIFFAYHPQFPGPLYKNEEEQFQQTLRTRFPDISEEFHKTLRLGETLACTNNNMDLYSPMHMLCEKYGFLRNKISRKFCDAIEYRHNTYTISSVTGHHLIQFKEINFLNYFNLM